MVDWGSLLLYVGACVCVCVCVLLRARSLEYDCKRQHMYAAGHAISCLRLLKFLAKLTEQAETAHPLHTPCP